MELRNSFLPELQFLLKMLTLLISSPYIFKYSVFLWTNQAPYSLKTVGFKVWFLPDFLACLLLTSEIRVRQLKEYCQTPKPEPNTQIISTALPHQQLLLTNPQFCWKCTRTNIFKTWMHPFITVKLGCQGASLIQNISLLGTLPVYKPKG